MVVTKLYIHCATIKRDQHESYRTLERLGSGAIDIYLIDSAILLGVQERLLLSLKFLTFAESILKAPVADEEINARNAVSRGYYSIHHALRAALLFRDRGDTEGHSASIIAFCKMAEHEGALRAKLGDVNKLRLQLREVVKWRETADYDPYGTSDTQNPVSPNFLDCAQRTVDLANNVYSAVRSYTDEKAQATP